MINDHKELWNMRWEMPIPIVAATIFLGVQTEPYNAKQRQYNNGVRTIYCTRRRMRHRGADVIINPYSTTSAISFIASLSPARSLAAK